MLSIRLQRTGRKKQAHYRVVVQDSRYSPTSGKVVAYLGSYNPHAKTVQLDNEEAGRFLENGAQPTKRVAMLFKSEGIKLPSWVKIDDNKSRTTRNPEKLRKHKPVVEEPVAEVAVEETTAAETVTEENSADKPAEVTAEAPKEEAAVEA